MALVSILRGFTPAVSVWITKQLIDSVVNAIKTHHIAMVWWFVGAQLAVGLLDRLLSTLSNIVQQLLQDRVSNRVQLLIIELDQHFQHDHARPPVFIDHGAKLSVLALTGQRPFNPGLCFGDEFLVFEQVGHVPNFPLNYPAIYYWDLHPATLRRGGWSFPLPESLTGRVTNREVQSILRAVREKVLF